VYALDPLGAAPLRAPTVLLAATLTVTRSHTDGRRSSFASTHRYPIDHMRTGAREPRDRYVEASDIRSLQRLFVGFAVSTGAFFASAEVQRGLEWSGRSI
jgi:hypothetical protein